MNVITSKLSNNTIESISLSALAQQCHISSDDLDATTEAELKDFLQASQNLLEEKYNVVFGVNSFESVFKIKNQNKIYLPKFPVISVEDKNIKVINGESVTILMLPYKVSSDNYTVKYSAGWNVEDIPADVIQCLKMLVSYYFNNRDAQQEKQLYSPAFAVEALMHKYNSQII